MKRWLPVLVIAASACGGTQSRFTDRGLVHVPHGYEMAPAGSEPHELLGPEWILTSHVWSEGEPVELLDDRRVRIDLDRDADGEADWTPELPPLDAVYEHQRSQGRVLIASFPGTALVGLKDVKVLAQDYVDSLTGSTAVVRHGEGSGAISGEWWGESHSYRTRVESQGAERVAGADGYRITFDMDHPDGLGDALTSAARRVQLTVVRHPGGWPLSQASLEWAGISTATPISRKATCEMPLYLLVVYSNRLEDFAPQAEVVDALLLERTRLITEADEIHPEPCSDADDASRRHGEHPPTSLSRLGSALSGPGVEGVE